MDSARLPGKVLHQIAGKPLLTYLLERLERSRALAAVLVATSTEASDDPVAALCASRGTTCHRGPLDDVAARVGDALAVAGLDAFVRVSGDSPLLDPSLVDRGVTLFLAGELDLVTNVRPRSFPTGQSVEVVRSAAFERARARMRDAQDLEHVTRFLYANPAGFRIENFGSGHDWGALRLSVDTEDDLVSVTEIIRRMERPHWEYGLEEILDLAGLNR